MAVAVVDVQVRGSGAVSQLQQVNTAALKLDASIKSLTDAVQKNSEALSNQGRSTGQTQSRMQSLIGTVGRLATAYVGLQAAQKLVQAGIQREESERRLQFLAKGYNEVAAAQQAAARTGKQFGLSATESNQQFAQLYGRLRPLNVSLQDIESAFIGFNTAAKVSGATSAESAGALLQLTQALGSGVLRGQELNSVLEQAPGLVVALTKELDRPVSEIRKLAEEGLITSDVVIRALKRAATDGAGQLDSALKGPAQQIKNLQNAFEDLQVALAADVIPSIISIVKEITALLKLFRELPGPLKAIILAVTGLTTAFVVLAPAIAAVKTLLAGITLSGLIAAAPWFALAAGITAAAVALGSYQTKAQGLGKAAATGAPADMAAARNELVAVTQEISLQQLKRKGATGKEAASIDRTLNRLQAQARDLRAGIQMGAANEIDLSVGGGTTGATAATGGKEKGRKTKDRIPELQNELRLLQRQTQFESLMANAVITKKEDEKIYLEGLGRETELLQQAFAIEQSSIPQKEKDLEIGKIKEQLLQSQLKTAQEILLYDQQQKEAATDALTRLKDEENLLQARLSGNEAEVMLAIQLRDLKKQFPQLDVESARATIEKTNALKQQIDAAQQLKELYADIGMTIKSGVVDAIQGAIDGTKSLQEVASNLLNSIANKLLDVAINLALFGAMSGTGTGGGLLGGLFKRANGGSVMAGQPYLVGERGPELFMPGRSGGIAPAGSFGGGASVVVNVDASGSNVQGNGGQANQLGKVIGAAVQAELIKQRRPGGLLA